MFTKLFGRPDLKTVQVWAKRVSLVLLVGAYLADQWLNYVTTHDSLVSIYGPQLWVKIVSSVVIASELGCMIRVLTPEVGKKEPRFVRVAMGIWATVGLFDLIFNWFFSELELQSWVPVVPKGAEGILEVVSYAMAFLIWAVQFGLSLMTAYSIDGFLHPNKLSSTTTRPRAQTQARPAAQPRPQPAARPTTSFSISRPAPAATNAKKNQNLRPAASPPPRPASGNNGVFRYSSGDHDD